MTVAALESPDADEGVRAVPEVISLMHSGSLARAACVAAELGIADLLADGPSDVNDLARRTRTHAPSLRRLLRALSCIGLCTELTEGYFALTPSGARLRSDAHDSLRSWVIWCGRYQWSVWGDLLYSVKTGESARNLASGTEGFGHLERDPQAAAVFNDAMVEMTRAVADEVVRAYDFSGVRRIADIGGGFGALAVTVLQAHPSLRGVIFDRPYAVGGAKAHLASAGLTGRCEVVTGDFFESVPDGCDAYLLKSVIHDWDDERSLAILRNCRRAMSENSKLLLIERVMPTRLDPTTLHRALVYSDLTMLLGPGGRERSVSELRTLLDAAGIALAGVTATALEYSILEGAPQ